MSEDTQPNNAAPDTDHAPPLEPAPVDEVRAFAAIFIAQTADAVAEAVERGIKNALADGGADAIRQLVTNAARDAVAQLFPPGTAVNGIVRMSDVDECAAPHSPEAQQAQRDARPKPTRALYPHPRGR